MTMVRARNIRALKAFLLIVLLVIFFSLFFLQVVIQYSGKYTNFYKIAERADEIEVPTFTVCTGWKESIFKKYDIKSMIFSMPPDYDTNLPVKYSIRNIYEETTYKLSKDFFNAVSSDLSKPVTLEIGSNEIKGQKYHVKQNPTRKYGMCYVLTPNQMWMKPFQETFLITIFRNITSRNMDMNKVFLQISSNETFNTIDEKMTGLKNKVLEQDFVGNDTYLQVEYTEENVDFIKDCSDFGFFKCFAENIAETKDFNCTTTCIPIIYEPLRDWMDKAIPRCETTAEENCMIGIETYKKYMQLKSSCLKQCKNRGSNLDVSVLKAKQIYPMGKVQVDVLFTVTPERITQMEYLIYDEIGMFGSIGGSLGLFVGFSLFDSICFILDSVLKMVKVT